MNSPLGYSNAREKILITLSYATCGIVGFILLLLRQSESHFLRYHVFQAIIVSLLYALIQSASMILLRLINLLLSVVYPSLMSKLANFSALSSKALFYALVGILLYCVIEAIRGKYSWIKWISPQVYRML